MENVNPQKSGAPSGPDSVEMPSATVWPLVLSVGVALLAAGLATTLVLSLVGGILFAVGLGGWIGLLLPGRGQAHEPLVDPALRPTPVPFKAGTVEHLRPGMAGYRMRLPEKVHPISAGIKGGIVGGLVMPFPAFAYGIISGHGIWFPINLLAGMVLPGLDDLPFPERIVYLEKFHFGLLLIGIFIHAVISVIMGLMYGVLLPTMPPVPGGPLVFGGVILPLLWTWVSYGLMGNINPLLRDHVDWPWFVFSQLVFGVAAAFVVIRSEKILIPPAGSGASEVKEWVEGPGEGQS